MSSPNYETQRGLRPDLAAIPVNLPESYIGYRVYPSVKVAQTQGRAYYMTVTADSGAETDRSAGEAPSRTLLSSSSATWQASEYIKRHGVERHETKELGGIEASDRLGAMASKRSVMRAIEAAHKTQLFTGTAEDISDDIINGLVAGAKSVKRYAGRLAFICSHSVYRHIIDQDAIKDRMDWSFSNANIADALSLNQNIFIQFLKGVFAFDEILIGDDDHWDDEGKAVVCKLPDPSEESHRLDPVLGKTMVYYPDGEQPYEVESFYDDDDKVNNYDATSWIDIEEFNDDAKYIVEGLSDDT